MYNTKWRYYRRPLFALLAFCLQLTPAFAQNMDMLRNNYAVSVTDKELCRKMLTVLKDAEQTPLLMAYQGAYQTIWANHVFNPIEKLRTFNKGKANINRAAELAKDNTEVIFIRYSVQKNCPRFLGYRDHIKEDRVFLLNRIKTITSPLLKKMVENLLSE